MNVVHGPNESGKSIWHAAIVAGLCGLRRSAGRTKAEHEFEARHRPWDGGDDHPWFVQAAVMLDDGRHIEIDRDLDNRKTDVRRKDLGGRAFRLPVHDGSPDGSMLLGLDRKTFPMTASVRQAGLVSDLGEPDALQQHLARAAAGGAGGTAAGALKKIDDYKREHVGLDRKNSTKPLRAAKNAVNEAEAKLRAAVQAHGKYLSLMSALQQHRREVRRLANEKARVEAQRQYCTAKQESDRLDAAISRIGAWEKRFSAGDPSRDELPELTDLALAWGRVKDLPQPETTHLPPIDSLEAQLSGLGSPESVPSPAVEEVGRCVSPLQGAGVPEAVKPAVPAVPVVVGVGGLVAAILVGAMVDVSYGVALAVLVFVGCLGVRRSVRSSTSTEARASAEVRAAACRQLGEWQLPTDPVAAVAEASHRRRAFVEKGRLEDDLRQRREFDAREEVRRQSHEDAWVTLRSRASAHGVSGADEDVLRRVQALVEDHEGIRERREGDVEEWGRFRQALEGRTPRQWRDEAAAAKEPWPAFVSV